MAWNRIMAWRGILVVVSWSLSITAITGQALFRQALLGLVEIVSIAMVSALGAALFSDVARAILAYFVSMLAGFVTVYFLAILPSLTGAVGADAALLQQLWIGIMVRALFPFPVMGFLVASLIGGVLGERYL